MTEGQFMLRKDPSSPFRLLRMTQQDAQRQNPALPVDGTRGKRAIYRRNEAKRNGAWYAREARDLPP